MRDDLTLDNLRAYVASLGAEAVREAVRLVEEGRLSRRAIVRRVLKVARATRGGEGGASVLPLISSRGGSR